jgi:uracil-DNA glycosylase family 4
MDHQLRLQYLEAMGIEVWQMRFSDQMPPTIDKPSSYHIDDESSLNHSNTSSQVGKENEWEQLQAQVSQCQKCNLCQTRTQTVFGTGNKQAEWMLIGEAPGQQEDLQGLPFVGNAGLLLTEMLRAIGLNRDEVYIANILKCRPPGNRDPKPDEVNHCREYLDRQVRLVQPKIIIAVGRISAQTLLSTDEPLARLRGKIHVFNNTPLVVIYHPAYLLRNMADKRKAWQDLQFALNIYNTR